MMFDLVVADLKRVFTVPQNETDDAIILRTPQSTASLANKNSVPPCNSLPGAKRGDKLVHASQSLCPWQLDCIHNGAAGSTIFIYTIDRLG
jgi:hypothetical protein